MRARRGPHSLVYNEKPSPSARFSTRPFFLAPALTYNADTRFQKARLSVCALGRPYRFRPGSITTSVPTNLEDLKELSNRTLLAFLKTEVDLGLSFAPIAAHERDKGNLEHYEQSKRKAIRAAQAIKQFKVRLPPSDAKQDMETCASELFLLISTL